MTKTLTLRMNEAGLKCTHLVPQASPGHVPHLTSPHPQS